jgi:molybdopterin converting factor small subunit
MIAIPVKLLGGIPQDWEKSCITLSFIDGATVADLIVKIRALNIDPDSDQMIISLEGRGIHQYPPGRLLQAGDEVMIFPNISGGLADQRTI